MKPDEDPNSAKKTPDNKEISKLFKKSLNDNYSRLHQCFSEIIKRNQQHDEESPIKLTKSVTSIGPEFLGKKNNSDE